MFLNTSFLALITVKEIKKMKMFIFPESFGVLGNVGKWKW